MKCESLGGRERGREREGGREGGRGREGGKERNSHFSRLGDYYRTGEESM